MNLLTLDIANAIAAWAYPAGIVLAILFPLIRICSRAMCGVKPYLKHENVMHDIFGGFAIPQFFIMIIYPMAPESFEVEPQFFAVAGLYGTYIMVADLIDHGRNPKLRTRKTDIDN